MATKIISRLQTPADADGKRTDIHLITDSDAVIVDDNTTLTERLNQIGTGVVVSETQPTYQCLWAQVLSVES